MSNNDNNKKNIDMDAMFGGTVITEIKAPEQEEDKNLASSPFYCKKFARLELEDARGFQYFLMGHFPVIMSNVFLSSALIMLSYISAMEKCGDDTSCDGKIYGFKPSSLITIIATISGILSAFILPIFGAIIDFTNHRKVVGVSLAVLLTSIQAIQIMTNKQTWFPMAILQAINGFLFQALELTAFSYLPEIKRIVGESTMTAYTSRFYSFAFSTQSLYLMLVIGISSALGRDSVETAQLGQIINVLMTGFFYVCGFYNFTPKQSSRDLPEGHSLLVAGFKQVFTTTKDMCNHYPTTLTWFFLAVLVAEAAASAFTTVAVTFLIEVLKFNGTQCGLVSLVSLLSTIPGSLFASFLMRKTSSPTLTMKICLIVFMIVNFVTFPTLTGPEDDGLVWLYAVLWGFLLGWFYPTEVNIYALLMPKGQESTWAGFFLYCTQILAWLPPLIFTIMNENHIPLKFGGIHLNIYFFLALICYQMMPSWKECYETMNAENKTGTNTNSDKECV
mmetsp:Transcript_6326/g.9597  ORF Transcript_6326/g.9597 Transcript_6326/m.9597 type:complete len:504 (-) Transcript_6326:29-1540(-)